MKRSLWVLGIIIFLGAGEVEAQTKKELKIYDKIMRVPATDNGRKEFERMKKLFAELNDEELLFRIASDHKDVYTRKFAMKKIAVDKIEDQERLFRILSINNNLEHRVNGSRNILTDYGVYKNAIRLDDADKFIEIVKHGISAGYSDGKWLRELIDELPDHHPFLHAIARDEVLNTDEFTLTGLARRITDQEILMGIVRGYGNKIPGIVAFNGITDQNYLMEIVVNRGWMDLSALKKITDQALLLEIVKNHNDLPHWGDAFDMVTDQDYLMDVVKNHEDQNIRRRAFARLDDASLEAMTAGLPKSDPMAVAVRIKTKKSDWGTEITNSGQKIENVISAMAIVDRTVKPAVPDIVAACHKYIRKGDESKIPELEFLLTNYGDKTLAEDYLNCGNRRLYDIGAKWSRSHGYNIGSGYGSHRAAWGSQR